MARQTPPPRRLAAARPSSGRPDPNPINLAVLELARLRGRVAELEAELGTAKELIDAQGKVSALLAELSRLSADTSTTKP